MVRKSNNVNTAVNAQIKEARKENKKASKKLMEKNLPSMSAVKAEVGEVMRSIMAPGVDNSIRFNSPYTLGPTALAQLHETTTVGSAPSTVWYLDTKDSAFVSVFRDPVRHQVVYDPNPSNRTIHYDVMFDLGTSTGQEIVSKTYTGPCGPLPIAYAQPDSLNVYAAHGPKLGVGISNGNKTYLWSQANYTWLWNGTAADGTQVIRVFKWTPRGEVCIGDFIKSTFSGAGAAGLHVDGYIRFEIYAKNATSGDLVMNNIGAQSIAPELQFSCTTGVFCHKSLPDYPSKCDAAEKVRMLSVGVLLTNTTAEQTRGGKICSKQISGEEPWYEYALRGYDSLARTANADLRDAINGVYGWLKPTTISDFEMTDLVDLNTSGTLMKFAFDLDSVRSYLAVYAVMATTFTAQITASANIEFESDDQWFQRGRSKIQTVVFEEALQACAGLPQFDENPTHMDDIMRNVRDYSGRVADAIIKYGPYAIKGAQLLAAVL